jgi:hypothetical protein
MTKKMVGDQREIMETYSSRTYDEMVTMLRDACKSIPVEQRDSVRFELDKKYYRYDDEQYVALCMKWQRPETDEEEEKREREERDRKKIIEENERRQYEALAKKYGAKK